MEPTELAAEIEDSLWKDHLDKWFPRCVLESGRFHAAFSRDWTLEPDPREFVVFQARMTWVCGTIGQGQFGQWAQRGAAYLVERLVSPDGAVEWMPEAEYRHVYGAAFAIYGLAVAGFLQPAQAIFAWMERALHDPVHGGYFEFVDRNDRRQQGPHDKNDAIGTPFGMKSQNSHIHILEAFTELASIWPDSLLLQRLHEVFDIVRIKLLAPEGYLFGIVLPDWTPRPWPVSYGHNIETAHLLISAADVLKVDATVAAAALVNHTLNQGVDWERGGIFYSGDEKQPIDRSKVWWSQAEALLGFAHGLSLPGVDRERCWRALVGTWEWIKLHQIDKEFGGWFDTLSEAGEVQGSGRKGHLWKAAYHDGRALLQTPAVLRQL